jgi:hypothetical protein
VLLGVNVAQHFACALAAAPAAGSNAEFCGEVLERAGAIAGAFANRAFSDCVAEAYVHE